jgi:low affinity Fe/Cu permease
LDLDSLTANVPRSSDALAMHVKLNEIVKAIAGASSRIINVEDLSEGEPLRLQGRYQALAKRIAEASPGKISEIPLR